MTIAPINITTPQVSNYVGIQPVIAATKASNDKLPKSASPTGTLGTIQENVHNIEPVVLYNAHGIIDAKNPNSLIAYI